MKNNRPWYMLAGAVFFVLIPVFAGVASGVIELPKTGQTTCYDSDEGAVIDCDGTGQDGDIQAGVAWPSPRFVDNGDDGTVTDKLTGLEWTKDANSAGGYMTWQEALNYVKTLNTGNHSDWRLPNVNELGSLVDVEHYNPALPTHPFLNVQSDPNASWSSPIAYWSSTSSADSPDCAWDVEMDDGSVSPYGNKTSSVNVYVWPVRAGQCGVDASSICLPKTGQTLCYDSTGVLITCAGTGQDGDMQAGVAWPNPRFVDNGDGTVTDSLTGLEWIKDANFAGAKKAWLTALHNMKTLSTGGHSDWRLPNRNELRSLVDYAHYNLAFPQDFPFTNVQAGLFDGYYWSSTSSADSADYAWLLSPFEGSDAFVNPKDYDFYVWPVRAGQVSNSPHSGLCPAKTLLGADNPKLENLRFFRDSVLARNAIGRRIIQIYYNNADIFNAALEQSPVLRAAARKFFEATVWVVRKQ